MKSFNINDAIKTAIQMEKDGYAFYKKAAAQTTNELGRTVFESLAADELVHLDTFQKMFQGKINAIEWENLVKSNTKYGDVSIFPKDIKSMKNANPNSDEMDALRMGMDSEKEAIDYYTSVMNTTSDAGIKKILREIIDQEKNHYLILQQEFSHLSSTGLWYSIDSRGA